MFPRRLRLRSVDEPETEALRQSPTRVQASRNASGGTLTSRVNERLAPIGDVAMGGTALATTQVNHQVQHDLTFAEKIAFPLLFLLALWVFRSFVAALLPLVHRRPHDPRRAAGSFVS